MTDHPEPGPALAAYMNRGNPEGRRIPWRELAALLDVHENSIGQYVHGLSTPTVARRLFIEAWTGGAVLATWWKARRDRKEGLIRARLRKMFPDFKPAREASRKTKATATKAKKAA